MTIDSTSLTDLYDSRFDYEDDLAYSHVEPTRPADRVPAEDILPNRIASRLEFDPYTHQALGLVHLADGENVTVATDTASGKTLVYALDIARRYLEDPESTSLLVYPMKALTQNQYDNIRDLLQNTLGLDIEIGVYDGDTEDEEKRRLRKEAQVILTNFAGLNHYLPHHNKWARFFDNLDLVVIDESHQYGGVHGMHVAWIIRRLKRVIKQYGNDPRYVLTTATIGNPIEHARALIDEDVVLVDEDGSEQGEREIVFWQPPVEPESAEDDEENTSTAFTANELTALLADEGVQTLMFTDSRTMTEVGQKRVSQLMQSGAEVRAYHAGHGKRLRRETERGLREGSLRAVISTSALELGIDVGGLDSTVLAGYPGTRQSFWQRIGRAGRGSERSLGVFVADYSSLDQYILRHPEYIFEEAVENAVIDLANNKVYSQHVLCAANEVPLTWEDVESFGGEDRLEQAVEMWKTAGMLTGSLDTGVQFARPTRPETNIDLYTTGGDDSFEVRVMSGEIDHEPIERVRAYRDFHEGAVVLHNGQEYIVEELNEQTTKPYVLLSEQDHVSYYTQSQNSVRINDPVSEESIELDGFTIHRGSAEVITHYDTYEEREITTNALRGRYQTETSPLTMQTHVMWIEPSDEVCREILREHAPEESIADLESDEGLQFAFAPDDVVRPPQQAETKIIHGGLHAAEHAMIGVAPLTMMMDKRDLGGMSTLNHPQTESTGALFVYDGVPGGVGFTHSMFERLAMLLETTREVIAECECGSVTGCPACSMDENCGDDNEPLHNPAAVSFLERLKGALAATDSR